MPSPPSPARSCWRWSAPPPARSAPSSGRPSWSPSSPRRRPDGVSATVLDVAVLERRFGSPEAVLVARVAAGDNGALASLYDQFSSLVHGIAFRVTCDRGLAEEVVQDVFVNLWERPGSFDPDRGSGRTWLATLAHRRAGDRGAVSEGVPP